eukprot:425678_1
MHVLKIQSMTTLVVRYFTLQIPPSHHSLDETIVRAHSSDMPLSCRASFCCGCVQLQCGSIIAYEVYVSSPYNPEFQMIMIGTFPVQLDPFLVVCADESKVISSCLCPW